MRNPDLDFENLNPDFPIKRTHSLFKQHIKSCNAKRQRHAMPENDEKQQ